MSGYRDKEDSLDSVGLLDESLELKLPSKGRRSGFAFFLHIIALVFYSAVTVGLAIWGSKLRQSCPCNSLIASPAREGVKYEKVLMINDLSGENPFRGSPRPEMDDAWSGILQYYNIRAQKEDLERINRTSVPLNDDDGGYLVTLDVFHELHCLNMLRKYIYRDYYPDNHTEDAQIEHVDHCIDLIRQVLMCHSDISLHTYGWRDDYRWPWPNFEIEHECRSWDNLMDWAKDHHVPNMLGPVLTHPTLGVSYRGDEPE